MQMARNQRRHLMLGFAKPFKKKEDQVAIEKARVSKCINVYSKSFLMLNYRGSKEAVFLTKVFLRPSLTTFRIPEI